MRFAMIGMFASALSLGSPETLKSKWGLLYELSTRTWVVTNSASPRLTRYSWQEGGDVLIAEHGPENLWKLDPGNFADTTQRITIGRSDGSFTSTYYYKDGRPPLVTEIILVGANEIVEKYLDEQGARYRNTYRYDGNRTSHIRRERLDGERWVEISTTIRRGTSAAEAEEQHRGDYAEFNRRQAAESASRQERLAHERLIADEERERRAETAAMAERLSPLSELAGLRARVEAERLESKMRLDQTVKMGRRGAPADIAPEAEAKKDRPPGDRYTTYAPAARETHQTTIRFYYVGGLTPKLGEDMRNPRCYSNVVTLSVALPTDRADSYPVIQSLVAPYRQRFVDACVAVHGQPNAVFVTVEGRDSGWPQPSFHPDDHKVLLP